MSKSRKEATVPSDMSLSDDLLIEILTKLPLKPLFRFNCVSKGWHGLIADDYLRRKLPLIASCVYYVADAKANRDPRYACMSNGSLQDFDLHFFPFLSKSSIIDCSNGLLLCSSFPLSTFYVCNPITKRWLALPEPPKKSMLSILAYDPSLSPHYKIVCFTEWRARGSAIEIFSSETGGWDEHEVKWGIETDTMSPRMHYSDGKLYILAIPGHMVSIDLKTMNCHLIELPEPMTHQGFVGRNRGRLHYTTNDGAEQRIWMLEDSKESKWVLKHSIVRKPSHLSRSSNCQSLFSFLAFHPELDVVYLWVPGKLISYDMRKKRFEEVCELGSERERAYPIQVSSLSFSDCLPSC